MGFTPHNPFDSASLILNLVTKKQKVIGANLANVNTPGYQRQDVNFEQVLGSVNSPLETKLSKKLGPSPLMVENGGEVSTSAELIELQKNVLFYTLATKRITSIIQEIKGIAQVGK